MSGLTGRVSAADDKAATAPVADQLTGVDYGTFGESQAQPGAQMRDPRDPFESLAADQMMGSLKSAGMSSLAKGATAGVMGTVMGAPAAIASQMAMQGMMPGIATGVGLVGRGISSAVAANRARNAYSSVSAPMGLYSDYMDETNPRAYSREEVQQMDATKFGLDQQARISKNPFSAIFGELPAYDPLSRGFVEGEDDPYSGGYADPSGYGGGYDDGSYSGEGRSSRGMRGENPSAELGGGTMGMMGGSGYGTTAQGNPGGFSVGARGYAGDPLGPGDMGDSGGRGYSGDIGGSGGSGGDGSGGDSGGGRAGNAGTSDASGGMGGYHKGGMIDDGDSRGGEEVMSRTLEGEFVFNRPATEYLMQTMGKRKMNEINRMGLSGMLK